MPVTDEDILQGRLIRELDLVEPGFAPVEAAIRQGRAIRTRRRATFGGVLAAAAVLAIATPIVLGQSAPKPAPASPVRHLVTVDAPHTNAKGQPVVSGSVDGEAWTEAPTALPADGCFRSFGNCVQQTHQPTAPVELGASSDLVHPDIYEAHFRADTARLVVDLADGEHLTLEPVKVGDIRFAAVKVPHGLQLTRATAYGADGVASGYSVPFNLPGSTSTFVAWYGPEEKPTQVSATAPILSGVSNGRPWKLDAYVGPFGMCLVSVRVPTGTPDGLDTGSTCQVLGQTDETVPSYSRSIGMVEPPYLVMSVIRPDVARIEVALSDGSTEHLIPVRVGGRSVAAINPPAHVTITSMTPFDAAGRQLPVVGGLADGPSSAK